MSCNFILLLSIKLITMKRFFTCAFFILFYSSAFCQLELTAIGTEEIIDFTGFTGAGFSASPTAGQLNSNTWSVVGFDDGDVNFGDEGVTGDFARGTTGGGVITGGVYSLEISSNEKLMVQPGADDFTPGSLILKLVNTSGSAINQLDFSYLIDALNDQNRANSFNAAYSYDNVSYTDIPGLTFTSPEASDGLVYTYSFDVLLTGITIEPGDVFYISWNSDDVSGSGSRDEIALDNISITPLDGGGGPTYNFDPSSMTVSETAGVAYFDLTLSESADCVFNLDYIEGTADLPTDFGLSTFTVTFTEGGPTTQTLDVGIVDDFEVETLESFILYLNVSSGSCMAGASDQIEIFIESDDATGIAEAEITDEIYGDEGDGMISGTVSLSETADCEVQLTLDAASTLTEGSDYDFTLPYNIVFSDGGALFQDFDIIIYDDTEIEPTEDLIINLNIVSGSCVLGASGDLDLYLEDNDDEPIVYTPVDIADIHDEDADGNCISLGDMVSLTGIVYGINIWDGGLQFTLRDATGGISVFSFAQSLGYTVTEGDNITVNGEIDQFNGLTEIIPDTIIFNSSGNALEFPDVISTINESTESDLLRIETVYPVNESDWLGDGSSFNVEFTDGTNNFMVRIDNNTELSTIPILSGSLFNVIGLGAQFDTEAPYTDGYQLMPRYGADLEIISALSNENNNSFSIYPNPTTDNLIIQSIACDGLLTITDQSGKLMMSKTISQSEEILPVQELPAGMYVLELITEDRTSTSHFIKL